MRRFGLVGFPLGHSFSRRYFSEKFEKLGLLDHQYDLYELEYLKDFPAIWQNPELVGVNITVPHKESIIPFLDRLDSSAHKVGAVNVVKREAGKLVGYNSDFYGFKVSLTNYFQGHITVKSALILGSGGAAKSVEAALLDLKIGYDIVSRIASKADLTYNDLTADPSLLSGVDMVINTTPLGMHPEVEGCPPIPYDAIRPEQYFYDLVYNPEETLFMKKARQKGARTKNGLEMLYLQADRAWEIWNSANGI